MSCLKCDFSKATIFVVCTRTILPPPHPMVWGKSALKFAPVKSVYYPAPCIPSLSGTAVYERRGKLGRRLGLI